MGIALGTVEERKSIRQCLNALLVDGIVRCNSCDEKAKRKLREESQKPSQIDLKTQQNKHTLFLHPMASSQ